jgi:hypothetical protein
MGGGMVVSFVSWDTVVVVDAIDKAVAWTIQAFGWQRRLAGKAFG